MGGGGFSMEPKNRRLDRFLLARTGARKPRVLFVPTASGDAEKYVARFYRAFGAFSCRPSHLALFRREGDLRRQVLEQDLVYVGGGNTANLLAVWRLHGVDDLLREAGRNGVALAGVSAGAICWFEAGVTDSFGVQLAPLHGGLGLLAGSVCPHYDGEARRRPTYRRLVASGALPAGYAADDSAALVFDGGRLVEAVASRPRARAFRVVLERGKLVETPLPVRLLDAP
jgi:dipeptidase E